MKHRVVTVLVLLVAATALPAAAGAVMRENLVCPVREDWDEQAWADWEAAERQRRPEGATECPCRKTWRPAPERLASILKAHGHWLETEGWRNPAGPGRAILCNADLGGATLPQAHLRLADFGGADLRKAMLWEANLRQANLSGADLRGAHLGDVDLREARLGNADLRRANMAGANLRKADLEGANLAGARPVEADLHEARLGRADLRGTDLWNARLSEARLTDADLRGARLVEANLERANLGQANLDGADLRYAKLQGADLGGASLKGADLRAAKLRGARLILTNLEDADLGGASLERAYLRLAVVTDARLPFVSLHRATYAPASPPPDGYVEGIEGLATVTFPPGRQSGLVQLRELFQKAGLRDLERQATFAIEHGKAEHTRASDSPVGQMGGWLKLVLFEWTTGWGLYPGRALVILLGLMAGLGFVYGLAAWDVPTGWARHGELVRVRPPERVVDTADGRHLADIAVVDPINAANPITALGWGLYFSLVSAFHIGWRDLNVGTWISRIQASEYALRGRGWVRVVSGVQSLISVYLVAMWALTYFTRPFQ